MAEGEQSMPKQSEEEKEEKRGSEEEGEEEEEPFSPLPESSEQVPTSLLPSLDLLQSAS